MNAGVGNHVTQSTSNSTAASDAVPPEPARTLPFDDAALVEACRRGEMPAFAALVERYQDRLYNALLRTCGDREAAADLCQEAFVKALERIGQFRGHSQFYTWLFRIGMNLALSRRRRERTVRFTALAPDPELAEDQAAALTAEALRRRQDPSAPAMAAEVQRRVLQALEHLEEEYRAVVVLRDLEEMDYQQIAEVLETPIGTIKSRLHRARCILRERLADLIGYEA